MADLIVTDGVPSDIIFGSPINPAAAGGWYINGGNVAAIRALRPDAGGSPSDSDHKYIEGRTVTTTSDSLNSMVNIKGLGDKWLTSNNFAATGTSDVFITSAGLVEFTSFSGDASVALNVGSVPGGSASGSARQWSLQVSYTDSTVSQSSNVFEGYLHFNMPTTQPFLAGRGVIIEGFTTVSRNNGPSAITANYLSLNSAYDSFGSTWTVTHPASQTLYEERDYTVTETGILLGDAVATFSCPFSYTKDDNTSGGASTFDFWGFAVKFRYVS